MGREQLQTLLVDNVTVQRENLLQALTRKQAGVAAFGRASAAMRALEGAGSDLVLVAETVKDRDALLSLSEQAGLEISILFRPTHAPERVYHGRLRFGAHKWAIKALAGVGRWWDLQEGEKDLHERYRKLLNRIGDGVVEVDAQDYIRWANAALQKALGDAQLTGVKLEQLVKPSDVQQLRTIRHQHSAGVVIPFPLRLASGQLVEVDPTMRFSSDGKLLGSSIVFRGVRRGADSERGRELFALYSVATLLSQAGSVEQAVNAVLQRIRELMELAGAGLHLLEQERDFRVGISLDQPSLDALEWLCSTALSSGKARIYRNLQSEEEEHLAMLFKAGIRGVAALPLQAQGAVLGSLWFISTDPGHFSREVVSLLISISVQLAVALENYRYVEDKLQEEATRRQFYRDALQAVTQGKLILCEINELESVWTQSGDSLGERQISSYADVPGLRRFVEETLRAEGFPDERCHDMALCSTEAAGNVIKHAEHGRLEIRANEDALHIRIEDQGPGIHFSNLPKAVLSAGFSTAPSLGMGYSILLELADSLHLATGDRGTCMILEVSRKVADPLEAFVGLELL